MTFLLGAWVGCIVGVLVVALCQAAGRADEAARQAQRLTGGEVKQ